MEALKPVVPSPVEPMLESRVIELLKAWSAPRFGTMRRARWMEEEQQQQACITQQQGARAQRRANYNGAFSVCMTGRGDTVST